MYTLFCIIGTFFYVVFQPGVLPFVIALVLVIVGYKKGWFEKQTKEDLDDLVDVAIMTSLMTSDDQD